MKDWTIRLTEIVLKWQKGELAAEEALNIIVSERLYEEKIWGVLGEDIPPRLFDALTKMRGQPEPLHETTAVLAYEVGKMLEQAMYISWKRGDTKEVACRRGFYISELIDAIAQLELCCESLDQDFDKLRLLGEEKALERFTGKEKKA